MPEFRHAKEVLTIGSLLAQFGARTYSPAEDVLSAHFFQLCQNPWRKYQESNHESVPTEPRTRMSEMWIIKKDDNYALVDKPGWRWGWGYIYRLGFSSSRPFSLQTSTKPWHKGLTARWYPWTWGSSPESDPNIDLMALWSLTTATFLPICAGKVRWIVCNIELQTKLREGWWRGPLLVLGPYPDWQCLLALTHLWHYVEQALTQGKSRCEIGMLIQKP